jgi:UDP-N-acetylenolpyruvoylglucosamine reductase
MDSLKNFDLKSISWIKIGGPAKELYQIDNQDDFIVLAQKLIKQGERFEILGWGANTLIADRGIDSIVLRVKTNQIEIDDVVETIDPNENAIQTEDGLNIARHKADREKGTFFGMDYEDINYVETNVPHVNVKLAAGVSLPYAINYLIDKGITGLQMFSGIPGTIGGSVFNNIHGGPRLLSEFIESVDVISPDSRLITLTKEELGLGYNKTRFQQSGEVIVSTVLRLPLGDKARARYAAIEWAKQKKIQPKNSLGSTFHNLEPEVAAKFGFPTPAAGYLIDKELNLGGLREGDAMIPVDGHRNMFVNCGNATAADYLGLMKRVHAIAYEKFGIELKPEIYFKGFTKEELSVWR